MSKAPFDWSLGGVRWGAVLRYQHWGALLLFVPAVVVIGVSHWTFQEAPVVRQALLYDATISYAHKASDTIPNSLAVLFNWLCFIVAVLVVELLLFHRQHSLTVAITGILHQAWCCAVNFVIIVAITEVTKPFSGRLRPDFLARCQPTLEGGAAAAGPGAVAAPSTLPGPSAAVGLGQLHLGQPVGPCVQPDGELVREGRLSFPSGHASNSMSVAWFTTIYMMWSLYLRCDAPFPRRLHTTSLLRSRSSRCCGWLWRRLLVEAWHALVYAFLLLTLLLSWFIGMTRFWDNVHNISDIVGGWLLAVIFTTPYVIKAIGLHTCFRAHIDGDSLGALLPVASVAADGSARAPAGPLAPAAPAAPEARGSSLARAVGGELGGGSLGPGPGGGDVEAGRRG